VHVPHLAILQLTILKERKKKIQKLQEINKEFHAWATYSPQVEYRTKHSDCIGNQISYARLRVF
jgi:hypothetical protein